MDLVKVRYPKIESINDLQQAIAAALESVGTMKKKVQIAAVACLIMGAKVETDEDKKEILDIVNQMVHNLGDGIRSKGLIAFFSKYGFRLDMVEKKNGFIKVKQYDTIVDKLDKAKAEHWYTMQPENPFQDYSFKAALAQVIKTAKAKAKDEEHADQIEVDMDMLAVIEALLNPQGKVEAEGALKLVERLAA